MRSLSIWHWLIVLLVVVLIFGTRKLRNMGSDLGGAVKRFREGMRTEEQSGQLAGSGQSLESEAQVRAYNAHDWPQAMMPSVATIRSD